MVSIHCPGNCRNGSNHRNLLPTKNPIVLRCNGCESVFKIVCVKKGLGKEASFAPEMLDLSWDGDGDYVPYTPLKPRYGRPPTPVVPVSGVAGVVAAEGTPTSAEGVVSESSGVNDLPPGAD